MASGIIGLGFLQNMTTPVAVGERIDVHVIPSVKEPEPDYEAMRRAIVGARQEEEKPPAGYDHAA
jgi:hypothetical protein